MTPFVCRAYTKAIIYTVATGDAEIVLGNDFCLSCSRWLQLECRRCVVQESTFIFWVFANACDGIRGCDRHGPAIIGTGSHIPFDHIGIKFYRAYDK